MTGFDGFQIDATSIINFEINEILKISHFRFWKYDFDWFDDGFEIVATLIINLIIYDCF